MAPTLQSGSTSNSISNSNKRQQRQELSSINLDGLIPKDEDDSDVDEDDQDFNDAQEHQIPTFNIPSTTSASNSKESKNSEIKSEVKVDLDLPPAFPSLNSHQRSSSSRTTTNPSNPSNSNSNPISKLSSSSSSTTTTTSNLSSSTPTKTQTSSTSASKPTTNSSLRSLLSIPPNSSSTSSSSSSLSVPPRTTALTAPQGVGGASGATNRSSTTSLTTSGLGPPQINPKKERKKVALAPGCSPLDWAKLKKETDLRGGITQLQRITPSILKLHNKREDAWSAFNGKVYNLTPYLKFHPGGEEELMRCAGRDGTRLFMLTHSWVNIDAMIDTAMVGMLVPEN